MFTVNLKTEALFKNLFSLVFFLKLEYNCSLIIIMLQFFKKEIKLKKIKCFKKHIYVNATFKIQDFLSAFLLKVDCGPVL